MEDFLNSEDFYDLMQYYRHTPISQQKHVLDAFEVVKKRILEQHLLNSKEEL